MNRSFTTWIPVPLDHTRISEAAKLLLGVHDFSAFRSSECQAKSAVRKIININVEKINSIIRIEIEANAFLHHMVRNIVGSLIWIGEGKKPISWLADLLTARDRTQAGPTAKAGGLYLVSVLYPEQFNLSDHDHLGPLFLPQTF